MEIFKILLIVLGLSIFEIVSSVDNAIINAEVLLTMGEKARKWFLSWGILIAVVVIRGLLPFLIVLLTIPSLGPLGIITSFFNNDPTVQAAISNSSGLPLAMGGTFLIFLFFNWLFLEQKDYGLKTEKFFLSQGVWFYTVVSIILALIVWIALPMNPLIAFGAVLGSTIFFVTHGFRKFAQDEELLLGNKTRSTISKLMYLEIIDASFSIDGVIGAFAFTFSVPLIFLGNGLGVLVLRKVTVSNIQKIKKYKYLKNGAMYSIFILGTIMMLESFGMHIPSEVSPIFTFLIVGYFYLKSRAELNKSTV